MCNYRFAYALVAWNEDELGEDWMNEDNMKALLYNGVYTKEELLPFCGFVTYDFETDEWDEAHLDYDVVDQYCFCGEEDDA